MLPEDDAGCGRFRSAQSRCGDADVVILARRPVWKARSATAMRPCFRRRAFRVQIYDEAQEIGRIGSVAAPNGRRRAAGARQAIADACSEQAEVERSLGRRCGKPRLATHRGIRPPPKRDKPTRCAWRANSKRAFPADRCGLATAQFENWYKGSRVAPRRPAISDHEPSVAMGVFCRTAIGAAAAFAEDGITAWSVSHRRRCVRAVSWGTRAASLHGCRFPDGRERRCVGIDRVITSASLRGRPGSRSPEPSTTSLRKPRMSRRVRGHAGPYRSGFRSGRSRRCAPCKPAVVNPCSSMRNGNERADTLLQMVSFNAKARRV